MKCWNPLLKNYCHRAIEELKSNSLSYLLFRMRRISWILSREAFWIVAALIPCIMNANKWSKEIIFSPDVQRSEGFFCWDFCHLQKKKVSTRDVVRRHVPRYGSLSAPCEAHGRRNPGGPKGISSPPEPIWLAISLWKCERNEGWDLWTKMISDSGGVFADCVVVFACFGAQNICGGRLWACTTVQEVIMNALKCVGVYLNMHIIEWSF